MTLMGLIASAPLPTRQPVAGQVPDVTAPCWQKDSKMLSHPREGEAYALHLPRASRWRLVPSPAWAQASAWCSGLWVLCGHPSHYALRPRA